MAFEVRDLTGTLFKNDKMMNDKSPQYTGSVLIEGVEYWQSAWVKESKNGVKFFSQSFKRKDAPAVRREEPARKTTITDDEIPF
jgi:hypothetical protein